MKKKKSRHYRSPNLDSAERYLPSKIVAALYTSQCLVMLGLAGSIVASFVDDWALDGEGKANVWLFIALICLLAGCSVIAVKRIVLDRSVLPERYRHARPVICRILTGVGLVASLVALTSLISHEILHVGTPRLNFQVGAFGMFLSQFASGLQEIFVLHYED